MKFLSNIIKICLLLFLTFTSSKCYCQAEIDSIMVYEKKLAKINKEKADSLRSIKHQKAKINFKNTFQEMLYLKPVPTKDIPKVAFVRSIIPGWGQYTNKQYWKVPIVATAALGGLFAIIYNKRRYDNFKPTLDSIATYGLTKTSIFNSNGSRNTDVNAISYPSTLLNSYGLQLRRNYNLSYIVFGAGWLLVAVEANVAAHLKSFDVSDDISMKISPSFYSNGTAMAGVKFGFKFK